MMKRHQANCLIPTTKPILVLELRNVDQRKLAGQRIRNKKTNNKIRIISTGSTEEAKLASPNRCTTEWNQVMKFIPFPFTGWCYFKCYSQIAF
jgi:hypothetical protein